jgi:ankyrin repeat protein
MTPLHYAAGFSNADFVAALLEAGADVNRGDNNNRMPLLFAC